MDRTTNKSKDIAAFIGVFILFSAFVLFLSRYFFGNFLYFRDISLEIIPTRTFLRDSAWPVLWNPYFFSGIPHAANPQNGVFYPLSIVFILIQNTPFAVSVYMAAHFLLAGIFFYALLRELNFSPACSAVGGFSYVMGGWFCSLGNLLVVLASTAWAPVTVYLFLKLIRTPCLKYCGLLGLCTAFQALGGEVQITYFTGIVCVVLWGFIGKDLKAPKIAGLKFLFLAGLLSIIIYLPQFLLTYEFSGLSDRAEGVGAAAAGKWTLTIGSLANIVFPHWFDWENGLGRGIWEDNLGYLLSIYPGIAAILGAMAGFYSEKRRIYLFALVMVLFGISAGFSEAIYEFVRHALPMMSFFRIPAKFMFFAGFGFAILAAVLAEVIDNGLGQRKSIKFIKPLPLMLLLTLGLLSLSVISASLASEKVEYGLNPRMLNSVFFRQVLIIGGFSTIAALSLLSSAKVRSGFLTMLLSFLCITDLFFAHFNLNPTIKSDFYNFQPGAVSFFSQSAPPIRRIAVISPEKQSHFFGRFDNIESHYARQIDMLSPLVGMEWGINDVYASSSITIKALDELSSKLSDMDAEDELNILSAFNVSHILYHGPGNLLGRTPEAILDSVSGGKIYKLEGALPRAFITKNQSDAPDVKSAVRHILAGELKPAEDSEVKIVVYENERIEFEYSSDEGGYLVLLDSHYPGWRVRIDGRDAGETKRFCYFFRSVEVPAGDGHTVEMVYRPRFLKSTFILSSLGFLTCVSFIFIPAMIRRRKNKLS